MILYQASSQLRIAPQDAVSRPMVIRVNGFGPRSVHIFRRQIQHCVSNGQPIIPIIVDSYGGEAYGVMAMIDILDSARLHATIATVVEGKAMSAGAWLLACGGDKGQRFVAPNATVMVHEGKTGHVGRVAEIRAESEESSRLEASMWTILDKRCGKPEGYFEEMVQAARGTNLYFSPKQAVDNGIADAVGLPQMLVSVNIEYAFGVPEKAKPGKPAKKAPKGAK